MAEHEKTHQILINEELQYSLWDADMKIPLGWKHAFGPDGKETCLGYVNKYWTDMRPKSLRDAMDKMEKNKPKAKKLEAKPKAKAAAKPKAKAKSKKD